MHLSTNRRIATLTAVGGALVLAPFAFAPSASAAGEIKVSAPTTIAAGTTGKVEFATKTDATVRIEFAIAEGVAGERVYSPDCTSPGRNLLDCTPKNGRFEVFLQLTADSKAGKAVTFSAKSKDGTGEGRFTVAPKPAKLGDLQVTAPPGSSVSWFEYDPSTGKVKDGIPVVLRNDGPDAYATAQATITAQEGVRFDGAPQGCQKVSDTKLTCPSNGSSAGKGEEEKLVIPATISGKRQAFVVDFTGTGATDRNKYDNEGVVMETAFDVKPTTPSPQPSTSTPPTKPTDPAQPTDSAKPVPPVTPSGPASPQPDAGPELAETGGNDDGTTLIAAGAAGLLLVGGGVALYARKRRAGTQAV
ncbi:LAETG motif-containing sortase-dependent surface protein [Yinghuangia sp. YIM S09857]|uniref:LAETG motif-containing sortase-dependent surface protein n=1 Tax=Yinghuangia sp. YIM S09857 TaxID=3436929 RepID=UPI003F52E66D